MTTSGVIPAGLWICANSWRKRACSARQGEAPSRLLFDEVVERAVGVKKKLGVLLGDEGAVPLVHRGISKRSRRQDALRRTDSAFQDVDGVAAGGVIMPRLAKTFRKSHQSRLHLVRAVIVQQLMLN